MCVKVNSANEVEPVCWSSVSGLEFVCYVSSLIKVLVGIYWKGIIM